MVCRRRAKPILGPLPGCLPLGCGVVLPLGPNRGFEIWLMADWEQFGKREGLEDGDES